MTEQLTVRRAGPEDAPHVARLLHDFNTEYRRLHAGGAGADRSAGRPARRRARSPSCSAARDPTASRCCDFRPALWTSTLDAYLEELYVAPARRGEGLGRALLDATLQAAREAGAKFIHLGTSEDDTAALGLYESSGFTNREGDPDGPLMLFYEREL